MSHRVTTQTQIKDRALAISALKAAGMAFTEQGSSINITGGPIAGAQIDLSSGMITGDTDRGHRNSNDNLGVLKRHYAEAKIRQELQIQGVTIEERIVEKNGSIRLRCQGHFA